MYIAISDDDPRLAAEPNGVVITSGGEAQKLMMTRALYKTPPSCCWTNPPTPTPAPTPFCPLPKPVYKDSNNFT